MHAKRNTSGAGLGGRIGTARQRYADFAVVGLYVPNSGQSLERLRCDAKTRSSTACLLSTEYPVTTLSAYYA